ncbi:alpha-keto acid decarboxylase family protein [Microbacterium marinilacus]|uniref:Alpha-keto-acid decarboxylase n=1 Tax=Microbacterium marinilacus TaxID=415209 RepID=A0ABP7BJ28_9MICO|nr:thiamine pyrophosphate-binding protein [Microbacterium marinilacus]MBY0689563.1 indolepyruvate decarboxylase [Microbacterium marinilacus]
MAESLEPTPVVTTTVGRYLATRLVQLGCRHLFGLPGDFNLNLLDEMLAAGDGAGGDIVWMGSANELNAAYAADGYARVGRTVGALVTTYGVGELSAVNGIAGAYAEDVPIVHIAGLPSRASIRSGARLHHTLLDGDFLHFVRMFAEVTAAQAVLDGEDAAAEIDRVLETMLATSKPVYLGVPLDVARAGVDASRLATPLARPASDPDAVAAFAEALRARVERMDRLTVLAGPGVHRRGLEEGVARLAETAGVRIASQVGSKAILDETHPASLGTYLGRNTLDPRSQAVVDDAGVLVMIGTVFSDFTTGFFSHRYEPAHAIELALDHARIGPAVYPAVRLQDGLAALQDAVADLAFALTADVPPAEPLETPRDDSAPLDHAALWAVLQEWIDGPAGAGGTTLIAEAGTAFYGALDLTLPARSDLLGQPVWSSIGYTLPAAWGAALARRDRRPVLVIGDGSAQLTVQELGRLLDQPNAPVVLLLDNDGYTVERKIQSPDAVYQDIPRWDWNALPAALGARAARVHEAATPGELRGALAEAGDRSTSHFVRVRLGRDDAPRLLVALAAGIAEANARA